MDGYLWPTLTRWIDGWIKAGHLKTTPARHYSQVVTHFPAVFGGITIRLKDGKVHMTYYLYRLHNSKETQLDGNGKPNMNVD